MEAWAGAGGAGGGAPRLFQDVACSADCGRLAAVAYGGGVWLSEDFGASWREAPLPAPGRRQYFRAVASSADGAVLLAVAELGDVWVSRDFGASWRAGAGAPQLDWTAAAASADGARLAAAASRGRVWTSADAGASWREDGEEGEAEPAEAASPPPAAGGGEASAAPAPRAPVPYAQFWRGLAASADGARLLAASAGDLDLGTNGGGLLWASGDAGGSWAALEPLGPRRAAHWRGVASSASGDRLLAAAAGGELWASRDAGRTWLPAGSPELRE